jgi:hypothetical protein
MLLDMPITTRSFRGRPEVRSDASSGRTNPMGGGPLPGNPAPDNGDESDVDVVNPAVQTAPPELFGGQRTNLGRNTA